MSTRIFKSNIFNSKIFRTIFNPKIPKKSKKVNLLKDIVLKMIPPIFGQKNFRPKTLIRSNIYSQYSELSIQKYLDKKYLNKNFGRKCLAENSFGRISNLPLKILVLKIQKYCDKNVFLKTVLKIISVKNTQNCVKHF